MKTALVLSGGGSRGAFQAGALGVLRERFRYDVVAGVSVGALNATMVAQNRLDRLLALWHTIEREDVFTGRWPWVLLNVLFGRKGLYDNQPLRRLIEREVDPAAVEIPLLVGAVSLESGQYRPAGPADPNFRDRLFASTIQPVIWPPIVLEGEHLVDGGVRNLAPLGDVIDHDPDLVVIVTTEPRAKPPSGRRIGNIVDVARRALEIVLDETFRNDLDEFLRINHLVTQAKAQGVTLRTESGRVLKCYDHLLVEPIAPLGSGLDFTRERLDDWFRQGEEAARRALDGFQVPA